MMPLRMKRKNMEIPSVAVVGAVTQLMNSGLVVTFVKNGIMENV